MFYIDVEKLAFDPQHTHSITNRTQINHTFARISQHYKSCAQLMYSTATPINGVIIKLSHYFIFSANLQRYNVEFAVFQYIRKIKYASNEIKRFTIPRTEFPIVIPFS